MNPHDVPPARSSVGSSSDTPRRNLTLRDAISIIVGTIIGAAIFHTPQWVAGQVDSVLMFMGVWVLGGALALAGGLCFAELTTSYNEDGGEYIYLREAFGRFMSFLYAWTTGWIIRPANIAAMAVTFAIFAKEGFTALQDFGVFGTATIAVTLLAIVNLFGLTLGKYSQNLLTGCKILGLLLLCGIGSLPNMANDTATTPDAATVSAPGPSSATGDATPQTTEPAPRPITVMISGLLMALVFVMYSFGGWNDISFVAAEIQEPNRHLPRALFWGIGIVTLIYLYINLVLVLNLGLAGLANATNAPAEVVSLKLQSLGFSGWSQWARSALGILVAVSCLGAINAMLITSPRLFYAAGRQHRWFKWFGHWNQEAGMPAGALLGQWLATVILLLVCSGLTGSMTSLLPEHWQVFKNENPFDELVAVSSPFFWGFLCLVVFGQMLLRITDPGRDRPVLTWAFPLPNLIFGSASLFMLYRSFEYAWTQEYFVSGGIVLALFGIGLILALYSQPPAPTPSR